MTSPWPIQVSSSAFSQHHRSHVLRQAAFYLELCSYLHRLHAWNFGAKHSTQSCSLQYLAESGSVSYPPPPPPAGQNIRKLVKDGFVIRKPQKIHSRARARDAAEAKSKGRHMGYGAPCNRKQHVLSLQCQGQRSRSCCLVPSDLRSCC